MMITQIGDTPKSQMASADTMGIHSVHLFNCARLAKLKVGTAIKATTMAAANANSDLYMPRFFTSAFFISSGV